MNASKVAAVVLVGLMAVVGVGCGKPKMGVYNITVTPDASLSEGGTGRLAQLEVDLVGVKESDAAMWRDYKVDSYFSGNDALRSGAKEYTKTMTFSEAKKGAQTLARNDGIWKVWRDRGVTHLFILASSKNLRGTGGGPELRRKELPLTTNRWKTEKIDIVVKNSGIDCPTPMEPLD